MIRFVAIFFAIFAAACSAVDHTVKSTNADETPLSSNVCGHIIEIKSIPLKLDVPVEDRHYNKLRADPQSAKSCLLDLITNETLMTDPRSEPTKVDGFVVGDLAFFLLSDFGLVSYDEVLPNEAKERGVLSYFAWVKQPGNRKLLQTLCADWIKKNVTN